MKNKQNNKLNLENVQELTIEEVKTIDGGIFLGIPWGAILRAGLGVGAAFTVHECMC